MLIKVCGITEKNNMAEVAATGPDMLGFIFYSGSKRYMADKLAENSLEMLPHTVKKVGVFVNEETANILSAAEKYGLDALQLHGNETPGQCGELSAEGFEIYKAFSIGSANDLDEVHSYEEFCDLFIFDTKTDTYGGSGKTFDWSLLKNYRGNTPFLLSGGIGPDLVDDLKAFFHPKMAGIDVNSRFETAPGIKNVTMLKNFFIQVR